MQKPQGEAPRGRRENACVYVSNTCHIPGLGTTPPHRGAPTMQEGEAGRDGDKDLQIRGPPVYASRVLFKCLQDQDRWMVKEGEGEAALRDENSP